MTEVPADPPSGYDLLLPPGWWRIPADPVAARSSIRTLLDRKTAGLPRDSVAQARAELDQRLRGLVEQAHEAGAVDVMVTVDPVRGIPVAASCVVTVIPGTGGAALEDVAARLGAGADEHGVVEVAGTAAVRVRRRRPVPDAEDVLATTVEYAVPVPGGADTLLLTWSTPMEPVADQLAALFDAITASLRWRWD